jgi:hypothetical protein
LPANIRLEWKGLTVKNTLEIDKETITTLKGFKYRLSIFVGLTGTSGGNSTEIGTMTLSIMTMSRLTLSLTL